MRKRAKRERQGGWDGWVRKPDESQGKQRDREVGKERGNEEITWGEGKKRYKGRETREQQ